MWGADIAEQDAGQHPPRLVVIDYHVRPRVLARPTSGVGLAVDHHDRRPGRDRHLLDRHQGNRDRLDHDPVLGPRDHPVDGQHDLLARLAVGQERFQAEHARQRIGIGIDVRYHHDPGKRRQGREEPLRAMLAQQEPLHLFGLGFGRHRVVRPQRPDGGIGIPANTDRPDSALFYPGLLARCRLRQMSLRQEARTPPVFRLGRDRFATSATASGQRGRAALAGGRRRCA